MQFFEGRRAPNPSPLPLSNKARAPAFQVFGNAVPDQSAHQLLMISANSESLLP